MRPFFCSVLQVKLRLIPVKLVQMYKPSAASQSSSRVFVQNVITCAGVASGLLAEDAYNMYDKPLFADKGSSLYRPKAATEDELAAGGGAAEGRHFKPDRGFAGVDYGAATRGGGGPVQFEKDQEEDPFGLEVGAEIGNRHCLCRHPGMCLAAGSPWRPVQLSSSQQPVLWVLFPK